MSEVANVEVGRGFAVERERELDALAEACRAPGTGEGRLITVVGPAGVGKTWLVTAAAEAAAAAGLRVARARGGELEQDLGWGVTVELLETLLSDRTQEQRRRLLTGRGRWASAVLGEPESDLSANRPVPALSIAAGLTWVLAAVAAERPVAILVDDAHWVDTASLRWLVHLSTRLESLPVLIVVGARIVQRDDRDLLARLRAEASVRLTPSPLSSAATAIVAARLGIGDAAACAAIYEVTGGNPFLVDQLVRHLAGKPVTAEAVWAARPEQLESLLWPRLLALGPEVGALAEAVAVFGVKTQLRRAAVLAGLSRQVAATAAERLVGAGIFLDALPLDFAHPLVRSVVADALNAARSDELHRRAARVLIEDGADAETAAVLLLDTEPVDERWAADLLIEAGARAMARGTYESAARLFERLLAEGTLGADRRHDVRVELGRALIAAGRSEGISVLREALTEASQPGERGALALELGDALVGLAHPHDAIYVYELGAQAVGEQHERLRLHLLAQRGLAALAARGGADETAQAIGEVIEAAQRSPAAADRAALSLVAIAAFWTGAAARACIPLAERALSAEQYASGFWEWAPDLSFVLAILAFCDAYEQRDAFLDRAIARAESRFLPGELVAYARWRSFGRMRQGRIAEAEADARRTTQPFPFELPAQGALAMGMYTATLVSPLVARGAVREAEEVLAGCSLEEIDDITVLLLLEARASLRFAQRRLPEARADLARLHREAENRGVRWLGATAWSADLAIVLHLSGEEHAARSLAAEHLARARAFGASSAVGHALRAAGTVQPATEGLDFLEEAVTVLAGTPARLEHAHALVALGSAKRRLGHRKAAIDLLGQASDLASRCGATPLVVSARQELQIAGARPRRERMWGPQALTAAERRVATLAASGASNREIAQELVLTRRTVETHLTSAYRKLAIKRRHELAAALIQDG